MYPYGWSANGQSCTLKITDAQDKAWYDKVPRAMAQAAGYQLYGDICTTIYPANGGTVDAWYDLHGTMATVIEVGASSKMPPESQLGSHQTACANATWVFLDSLLPDVDPNDDDDDSTDTGTDTTGGVGNRVQ